MKKFFTWLLIACIVLSMVACGTKQGDSKDNSGTPTKITAAPTSAPTDALTAAPTETPTKTTAAEYTSETVINVGPKTRPTATILTRPTAAVTTPTGSLCSYPTTKPTAVPTKESTSVSTIAPTAVATTAPTSESQKTPMHQQTIPYAQFDEEYPSYKEIYARHSTSWDSEWGLDVPIYYGAEILGSAPHYQVTSDSSYTLKTVYTLGGEYGNGVTEQFYRFPTNAIRMREDGTSYLIYDTETDYRLYVFVADVPYLMGYPIVINKNKMLSRDDFNGIQVGDSIEKVASIDDIIEFHKKVLYDDYYTPIVFENSKKYNDPIVSVHYLTDGILRIKYAMPVEGNIVVANVEFFEDYIIPTADGKLTSHKIKDIDLPVS